MKQQKVLILSGSTRQESLNKKLCFLAKEILEKDNQVSLIDLKEHPIPLYDGDYEKDNPYPEKSAALKKHFLESQIIIFASPEYNGGISAVLKNTIDWLTRSEEKKADLSPFKEKTAILMSASPSIYGGVKSLLHLRLILSHIKMLVLPEQFNLANAHNAFDEQARLKDPKNLERLTKTLLQKNHTAVI